ncbi:MAG: Na+/H+ antiporter NhaA ['Candidatus Kapabacteria' thiocyanatum]|uniref:Na(+)/H(+) antiporter NhaA n=1 Tax=Candidatus Kapaibacterium thiocyanatum TaxID=1895771 RepID=A0A1M3L1C3_9BACT|nr:Na+/H+ antiporter NhaA ['Candidatus Kapabacteria' thiocyanatum]OJX58750.1 MAG: Na+/H+ antiporter NhaA ['Candidatus Kapabacteria' thiocyanatum]
MQKRQKNRLLATPLGTAFQAFFRSSSSAGIVILVATAVALAWINSPLGGSYHALLALPLEFMLGSFHLHFTLGHFVNDGLMVVFFLSVGLEIKREMLVGELSSLKKALLPMIGAVFGMLFPALIYLAFNAGTPTARGWGVPVATDIAFALGILALLGNRVPLGLKVFLAALAIVDDLLSVLVIALFYSASLDVELLLWALVVTGILYAGNRIGIHSIKFYTVFGIVLWLLVLFSGVHATIAGVVLALTIPARPRIDRRSFFDRAHGLVNDVFRRRDSGDEATNSDAIHQLEKMSEQVQSPLIRIEHALQPYVSFVIMPVFALANSGVAIDATMVGNLFSPVSLGIALGLFLGKQIGVSLAAWLSVRFGWATLPDSTTLRHIYGVSLLCGIGFTMALFVANLAFTDQHSLDVAKLSILVGSTISAVFGLVLLSRSLPATTKGRSI